MISEQQCLARHKYFSGRDVIHVYVGWIVELESSSDQPGIYVPVTTRRLLGRL